MRSGCFGASRRGHAVTAEEVQEDAGAKTLDKLDIEGILAHLPHRYPFLMIDRIIEIDGIESAIGIKNVTINEPVFLGHFPGKPIFPGVLIIEGMAQTAGAIALRQMAVEGNKSVVLLLGVDKCRFRKPAQPGDQIEYHIRKIQARRNIGRYEAIARVSGVTIAEAEVTAMMAKE